MKKYYNTIIEDFNLEGFTGALNNGDIYGLDYLEKTIIKKIKEININTKISKYTKEEYIANLFYAVKYLNNCIDIYESCHIENNFKYDLYTETRDLLFKELGFNVEKLYK